MAEDWAINVRKYAPDADDAVIAAIVKYCGVALNKTDSSLVSFSDAAETKRVRDTYCRKKLGITDSDDVIDAAIVRVGERMSADPTRNRVTVYYLLAHEFGRLGLFSGTAGTVAAASASAAAGAATLMGAAPAAAAQAPSRDEARDNRIVAAGRGDGGGYGGFALAVASGLGAIIIGTATAGSLIGSGYGSGSGSAAPPADFSAPVTAAAPAASAAPAAPAGAGVVTQDVEGMPMVSVYFDTAKTDIAPGFAAAAAPVKAWLDSHPGYRLAVSGFNDPRGDAAFNAELSKNRAQAVAAALAAIGVPAETIDLEKPPETTDANADLSRARRVDIVVKPGG